MSRRDTIIIAVLLNTGLLAVLFMLAINTEDEIQEVSMGIEDVTIKQIDDSDSQDNLFFASDDSVFVEETNIQLQDFSESEDSEHIVPQDSAQNDVTTSFQEPQREPHNEKQKKEPQDQFVDVTVKKGDFLGKIAIKHDTTIREIRKANHLSSDRLKIGQILKVPVGTKERLGESGNAIVADASGANLYTIKSGDNLWNIAKKFHVSVRELLRINNLDEGKARSLRPGDRIRVP